MIQLFIHLRSIKVSAQRNVKTTKEISEISEMFLIDLFIKWQFAQKSQFCQHLLIFMLFQTLFFIQLNTKEDILKKVGN